MVSIDLILPHLRKFSIFIFSFIFHVQIVCPVIIGAQAKQKEQVLEVFVFVHLNWRLWIWWEVKWVDFIVFIFPVRVKNQLNANVVCCYFIPYRLTRGWLAFILGKFPWLWCYLCYEGREAEVLKSKQILGRKLPEESECGIILYAGCNKKKKNLFFLLDM